MKNALIQNFPKIPISFSIQPVFIICENLAQLPLPTDLIKTLSIYMKNALIQQFPKIPISFSFQPVFKMAPGHADLQVRHCFQEA